MTHWQALRTVPGNTKRGPAGTAGTGKSGNRGNRETGNADQPQFDSFLLGHAFFHSTPGPQTRLPGTRHAATVSRSRFPGNRGPPSPLFRRSRYGNRL